MQEENWKPVVGYDGIYEVSDLGRVRSIPRIVKHHRGGGTHKTGKMKTQSMNAYGYLCLGLCRDGKNKTALVHTLVAQAFLTPSVKPFVNHKDFNKTNNCVDNLEWVTSRENLDHAVAGGRMTARVSPRRALRLNPDAVHAIRSCRLSTGRTYQSIADEFGIHRVTVGEIIRNEIWQ